MTWKYARYGDQAAAHKRAVADYRLGCLLFAAGVFKAKRKPSPRKLEPHEVIAKLKARRSAEKHP